LADLLAKKGGLRGPVNILLVACETGWHRNPYALNLKVELVQRHKIMCAVSADTVRGRVPGRSLHVGEMTPDGGWSAKTPDNKAMYNTAKNLRGGLGRSNDEPFGHRMPTSPLTDAMSFAES